MRLNKKHTFIAILLLIVIVGGLYYLFGSEKTLTLEGEKEIVLTLNQDFQDPGVNIKDAKVSGDINIKQEGVYTLTYTYHNQSVERTVKVVDSKRVVMNLNGSQDTYVKLGDPYIESGCHAIDKKEGNLTSSISIEGKVDT